ncbi:MAG: 2-dehydropantoate 2-reductase [Oleiphilaceae bacterium]|nr:2-dehydropantoate 2-reductase [Oleiphilaceae bacterium]
MAKLPCRIVIFGAGTLGCYLGGRLLSAGADVTMIGRERLQAIFAKQPLVVTDQRHFEFRETLPESRFVTDPAAAKDADLVLVTTKSGDTEDAGKLLAPVLKPGTPVVSFQNGISNPDRLAAALPECPVFAGVVPFNIVHKTPGHFHQAMPGQLMVTATDKLAAAEPWFDAAGLPLQKREDMRSVRWSKLLLNLNNAINALSGLSLADELAQRDYRRCLALAQQETLTLLEWAGIRPVKLTPIPMQLLPYVMKAPDWLFRSLAKTMLTIDPEARSSMAQDIQAGRPTEVDWINGEVVRLASSIDTRAPVNQALVNLIHQSERGPARSWPAAELFHHLQHALDEYRARR